MTTSRPPLYSLSPFLNFVFEEARDVCPAGRSVVEDDAQRELLIRSPPLH